MQDDASWRVTSWVMTREEEATYKAVHPVGAGGPARPAFVIPVTWLSPVIRGDVHDMADLKVGTASSNFSLSQLVEREGTIKYYRD